MTNDYIMQELIRLNRSLQWFDKIFDEEEFIYCHTKYGNIFYIYNDNNEFVIGKETVIYETHDQNYVPEPLIDYIENQTKFKSIEEIVENILREDFEDMLVNTLSDYRICRCQEY